jgi:1-acyl-sn-glycerol-3-phosphate acyltransferase
LKILLVYRLGRVVVHLAVGMATCGLLFPWLGMERRNRLIRRWSRQLLRICGVKVEQVATAATVLPHAMIVANHVSWLDIFVINALYPCRFVAKAEIRAWPMVGWLAEKAGTIFITRGRRHDLRHLFKGLVATLHAGGRVAFFPEGTTAEQGALLPFHPNLFEAAIDAKIQVQALALRYVDAAGQRHPAIVYVGDTTFAQSLVAILSGGPIAAQLICLPPIDSADAHRRDLAVAARAAVARALGQAPS